MVNALINLVTKPIIDVIYVVDFTKFLPVLPQGFLDGIGTATRWLNIIFGVGTIHASLRLIFAAFVTYLAVRIVLGLIRITLNLLGG